ncbi:MAG: WG repeat-containing protein [Sphingobacteriales bacterium]|nr:MAG: WG repeat-containing protein [Sphingobacteriales bacterium]
MKKLLNYSILFLFFVCGQTTDRNQQNDLFSIKEFGKWGFINTKGQTVIKCQFDEVGEFSNGLAAFLRDSLYGFIDMTGKVVIEPKYFEVSDFSDGLCKVSLHKGKNYLKTFIRPDGNIAFETSFEVWGNFKSGLCKIVVNNEVCFIDKNGQIVHNTHKDHYDVSEISEGIISISERNLQDQNIYCQNRPCNRLRYIDVEGNVICEFYGNVRGNVFSDGLALVEKNDTFFYIGRNGQPKIKLNNPNFKYSEFSDGMAMVVCHTNRDYKCGFIDVKGNLAIPLIFDGVNDFKEGYAAFIENDLWGFINKKGEVVIKPQFDFVGTHGFFGFKNGLCFVVQNAQFGYINYDGEYVWKEQNGFEYQKPDLSKFELDTLEVLKPFYLRKNGGKSNQPRAINFELGSTKELTLQVDTTDITIYLGNFYAYKLFLINASNNIVNIHTENGLMKIIQQAKNEKGEWKDIEHFVHNFCGNYNYEVPVAPNEFQIFATPIFKGDFNTQRRFKLEIEDHMIYSNSYSGQINRGQLNLISKEQLRNQMWGIKN